MNTRWYRKESNLFLIIIIKFLFILSISRLFRFVSHSYMLIKHKTYLISKLEIFVIQLFCIKFE